MSEPSFQIFFKSLDGKTFTVNDVTKTKSIQEVGKDFLDRIGVPISSIGDFRFVFGGKQLLHEKKIGDYNIKRDATIHVAMRLRGGAVSEECAICTDEYDNSSKKKIVLNCNHFACESCIVDSFKQQKSKGEFPFQCPLNSGLVKCGKKLYDDTLQLLSRTNDVIALEFYYGDKAIALSSDYQNCPSCNIRVFFEGTEKDRWVVCPKCYHNFCFYCLKNWKGNVHTDCHEDKSGKNDILAKCSEISLANFKNVPHIRSCPECFRLIEHLTACKHMTCACKTEFCFVCLRRWGECGHLSISGCNVAPRQHFK